MAAVYRRTLDHLSKKSPRKQDDERSEVSSPAPTPGDELTSWLGDDLCANCGNSAPRGQLYCSKDCREADSMRISDEQAAAGGSSAFSMSAKGTVDAEEKFRYRCPPSPNLLAQYSYPSPAKTAALTSPALTALDRAMPSPRTRGRPVPPSTASTVSSAVNQRRSNSQSTFSSISEADTSDRSPSDGWSPESDLTTPSPSSQPADDSSSDPEPSDLVLPPSAASASAVLLKKAVARTGPPRSSPIVAPVNIEAPLSPSIWYARRPSSTNLPPPVLYTSPAITATTKITAIASTSLQTEHARQSSQETVQASVASTIFDLSTPNMSRRKSSSGAVSPRTPRSDAQQSVPMLRSRTSGSTKSPPMVPSATSSAGATFRADTPLTRSPLSSWNAVCDRPGCPGTPTKRSGDAKSGVRRPSLRTPPTPEPQARSSRLHRHTHSAMAGFADLTQVTQQPPLAEASTSAERVPLPEPAPSEEAAQQAAPQSVQTRGRSKARDRRSSSRRAYSPPRGAARREPSQGTVNNISPISPLSSPISISRGRRDRLPGDTKTSVVSTQDDDAREGWSRGHGRGRSIRRELQDTCEMAWPGYGHDEDSYRDRRATQVPARLTTSDYPGWDDVEGLELEGEELVKPSRARAVSPRSPVDSLADDESSLSGSLGSAA